MATVNREGTADASHPSHVSAAIEDYVKAVYAIQHRAEEPVSTNAVAERLGVTPGSASAMLKKLAGLGLVTHALYHGVMLTSEGEALALQVLRHHRLLELYLAQSLGVPWDRVHAEAEVLEHVLSEELEERIAAQLGNPTRDPHGDPIPTREGRVLEPASESLDALEVGSRGRFVRVSDSDSAMLCYLAERGIAPGDELEVIDRQPFGGPLYARFGGPDDEVHALGGDLAKAMRVEVVR